MRRLRAWLLRLAGGFARRRGEEELTRELESNLQLHIDANVRSGMPMAEARRLALVRLGGVEAAREACRDRRRVPAIETLLQDLRYAARTLGRSPGFAVITVLTLSLGIGANTAIFTMVHALLLERLPFRDSGRLAVVWESTARFPERPNVIAPANFVRWQERSTSFENMAAFDDWRANFTGQAEPEELIAQDVTPNFFSTLGVEPLMGRGFAPDEGPPGHDGVTVLSYALWQRRFAGDASVIGRSIELNSRAFTVIGVMPADAGLFIKAGSLTGKPAELWTVFTFTEAMRIPHGRYLSAIARLKPDVTLVKAQAEMATIAAGLTVEFPQFDTGWNVRLVPIRDELSGKIRPALLVLSGAVAFVLLIACANVSNLMLARGASRQREIAIRAALGAGRARVVRQLLTESLVLGGLGGAMGLVVAYWSLKLLLAIRPLGLILPAHVQLSYPVLGFTALISIATAAICGFAPALEGARTNIHDTLKDGARLVGFGARHRRLRQTFVVAEVALSVVLLSGAGLMLRSLANLNAVDPGFDSRNVLTMRLTLPGAKYPDTAQGNARVVQFFQEVVRRVREMPGVRTAGMISYLPFAGAGTATGYTVEGQPPAAAGQQAIVDVRICDNGYFGAMNVALIEGRLFSERETSEQANVVIINQTMARLSFPGEDPIGKRITISLRAPNVPTEVIGVVADVKHVDLTTVPRAMAYWPHPQLVMGVMTLTVKSISDDPMALAPAIQRAIQSMDKDQPVADIRTMEQWVAASLAQTRFSSTLLVLFAGLALMMAAMGIYGVMSYVVSQRRSEIGIRIALGANAHEILGMIAGNTARLVLAGLVIGLPLALLLSRTLTTLLYQATANDPVTFSGVALLLGAVAMVASYLPARRAMKVTPLEALRHQ